MADPSEANKLHGLQTRDASSVTVQAGGYVGTYRDNATRVHVEQAAGDEDYANCQVMVSNVTHPQALR